jgi:hypothetical protein
MGAHTDDLIRSAIKEAYAGPAVSAAPGHFLLHLYDPERAPEPILAWRIGDALVLPVTALGCAPTEHYVLYPDGSVRPHFMGYNGDPPTFKSFAEWHDAATGQNGPPKKKKKKLKAAKPVGLYKVTTLGPGADDDMIPF